MLTNREVKSGETGSERIKKGPLGSRRRSGMAPIRLQVLPLERRTGSGECAHTLA